MTSLDTIARIAREEFAALPAEIRALTGSVAISVADDPTEDQLAAVDAEHPDDLLGLFEGVGLIDAGATAPTGRLPNRVWLFRRPILAFVAEGEDTLREVVRHVLVHEIGHHFGLSDDDMYAIDDAQD
jgi:predicted Zn-dependent protease with MMP-like domain